MEIIKLLHGVLRWAVLLLAILSIVKALQGMLAKKTFTKQDNLISLIFTSICDLQLLMGLYLYFFGASGLKNIQNQGMKEVMGKSYDRFFAVEHITMMILAIALVHIGRVRAKKASSDLSKHKNSFWFYLIALILILASIPWPFKAGFEGFGWF